jgi:hypothetical protein
MASLRVILIVLTSAWAPLLCACVCPATSPPTATPTPTPTESAHPSALPAVGRPYDRAQRGVAYEKAGNYGAALKEYLWCLDHGMEAESMFQAYRDTALVAALGRLLAKYPPTRAQLRRRLQRLERRLISGRARYDGSLFVRLSQVLGDAERGVRVFQSVEERWGAYDDEVDGMWSEVLDILLAQKRYDDIVAKSYHTNRQLFMRKDTIALFVRLRMPLGRRKATYCELAAKQYEALLGTKLHEDALELADNVLEFERTGATFALLMTHAARAGAREATRELYQRAKDTLPPDELAVVDEAARALGMDPDPKD